MDITRPAMPGGYDYRIAEHGAQIGSAVGFVEFRHTSGYEDSKSSANPDLGTRASIGSAFSADSLFAR